MAETVSELSELKVCPACGTTVPTGLRFCPKCNYRPTISPLKIKTDEKIEAAETPKVNPAPLILIVLVLCSSFLMLSSSLVNVTKFSAPNVVEAQVQPKDLNFDAYAAAKRFISVQFPDAQKFSEYRESPIDRTNNNFRVLVFFDSLNTNGASLRNVFSVEMEWADQNWKLKKIKQ